MALELPTYKMPSIRTSLLTTYDRALMFIKKAGTIIFCLSVILWALTYYPRLPEVQKRVIDESIRAHPAFPTLAVSAEDHAKRVDSAAEYSLTQNVEKAIASAQLRYSLPLWERRLSIGPGRARPCAKLPIQRHALQVQRFSRLVVALGESDRRQSKDCDRSRRRRRPG